ncbi:MAG: DUF362 domain-containing protein [Desulfobacterales bacterium]|nr:DUF362 domain-containing protein [Desulfobacterales bacterium]
MLNCSKKNATPATHTKQRGTVIKFLLRSQIEKSRIIVGDSSVIGLDTRSAAMKAGIIEICDKNEIVFFDLNEGPFRPLTIIDGLFHQSISVHGIAVDPDVFIINLAKIKTTYGSPVGLCVKNLKGLISSEDKLNFHLKGVQESLVDLRKAITCELNILEGFPGSELGISKKCNLMGISQCDFFLDSIVSEIIGIPFIEVPHLEILMRKLFENEFTISEDSVVKTLRSVTDRFHHAVHGVQELADLFGITIVDGKPCTACLESFYKALTRLNKDQALPFDFTFILGLWHANNEFENISDPYKIFIGECALGKYPSHYAAEASQTEYPNDNDPDYAIPGCPPTIDSMVKHIKKASIELLETQEFDESNPLWYHKLSLEQHCKPSPVIRKWIDIPSIDNITLSRNLKTVISLLPPEEVSFHSLGSELAIQCEFIAAAICHQMNWDFIRKRIKGWAYKDAQFLTFKNLNTISKRDIEVLFQGYHKPERIKSEERAKMLRGLSSYMLKHGNSLFELLNQLPRKIETENGLMSFLRKTPVFSDDPEMKKAQVFIHSILRERLWEFLDDNKVQPAIDYHIMRLYIRRGNIWPRTKNGELYLKQNIRRYSKTTVALRTLVADALKSIAGFHNLKIVDVNSAEWWVGRSVCKRDYPDCDLLNSESEWLKKCFTQCPYKPDCAAWTTDKTLLTVTEPREESKFY